MSRLALAFAWAIAVALAVCTYADVFAATPHGYGPTAGGAKMTHRQATVRVPPTSYGPTGPVLERR